MSEYKRTANTSNWSIVGRLRYDYLSFYDFDNYGFEFSVVGSFASSRIQALINDINANPTARNHNSKNNLVIIDDEYMSYDNIIAMPNGGYRAGGVVRGIFDTLPQSHYFGTMVYFIGNQLNVNSMFGGIVATEGNSTIENLEITTGTHDQEQPFNMDEVETFHTTRRSERPSIVANLRFGSDRGSFTRYFYESALISIYSYDILFNFIGRNKFNNPSILLQTALDPVVDMYAHVKLCIEVDCNGVNFKRFFDLRNGDNTANITDVRFTWADFCNHMNTKVFANNSVSLKIMTYDESKDLYSHQFYQKNINWGIPRFGGVVLSDGDVQAFANTLISTSNDCIILPETPYSIKMSLPFDDCVLVFIGSISSSGILAQDGNKYVLSNIAYRIDGYDSSGNALGHKVDITDGFIIRSGYTRLFPSGEVYYKYTSGNFVGYAPTV